jgi:hypothetical protein
MAPVPLALSFRMCVWTGYRAQNKKCPKMSRIMSMVIACILSTVHILFSCCIVCGTGAIFGCYMAPVPLALSFRMCVWTGYRAQNKKCPKMSRIMSMVCCAISKSGGQMEDIQFSGPFFCREADCKNGPWKEFRDFSKHLRKKHSEKKSEWDSMIVERSRVLHDSTDSKYVGRTCI